MAVELMTGYNTTKTFTSIAEQNVVQGAASGLESVEKPIFSLPTHNDSQPSAHLHQTASHSAAPNLHPNQQPSS